MMTIEMLLKSGHVNTDRHEWNYQTVIKQNAQRVFIYDYPIEPKFKDDFEFHVLSHFYKRNIIGVPGEFCYYLSEKLNNLFPYYNEVLKRVGNYEELFGNGEDVENYTRTFDEDSTRNIDENGNSIDKRKIVDIEDGHGSVKTNNVNRDFPTSVVTDISKYMTDSQNGDSTTTNGSTLDRDDTNNNEYTTNGKDVFHNGENETTTRTKNIKSNINMYDYFKEYRKDIDEIYNYIYKELDVLFYFVL